MLLLADIKMTIRRLLWLLSLPLLLVDGTVIDKVTGVEDDRCPVLFEVASYWCCA